MNPSTTPQTLIRGAFSAAATAWLAMTQANRDKWGEHADTVNFTGPLGDYTVPGRQLFIGYSSFVRYIIDAGLGSPSILLTPPTIAGRPTLDAISVGPPTGVETGFALSLTNNSGETMIALAELSIGFPQSRQRYQGPWPASSAQAIALPDSTSTKIEFTDLIADQAYFCRVRAATDEVYNRLTIQHIVRAVAELGSI